MVVMRAQVGPGGPRVKRAAREMVDRWLTGIPGRSPERDSARNGNGERSSFLFLEFLGPLNQGPANLSLASGDGAMTAKERVWRIADRILADGKGTVTVQAVVDALVSKEQGTQRKRRDVGLARGVVMLHVREWKVERAYKPRLDLRVLPVPLQEGLTEFAKTVWEGAVAEATARLDDQRRLAEAERAATDELLREAGAKLDGDAATGELRVAEVKRLRAENASLRAEVERVRKRLDHIRAEEFWDRVMREVFALIPPRGAMMVEEILPRLRQSTLRGARLHREPLDVETLRKKMDVRVHHEKFFVRNLDRTYRREPRHLAAIAHGET